MPKLMDRKVLIIDVESTCWEPPEYQPAKEISEIIEIGIAVVDLDTRSIVENSSILVKPQKSKVSKFCTQLTTLTQEQVDTGIKFSAAMKLLEDKYDAPNRTFISWGDYDRKMFERNCRDYTVRYPFGQRHMNLKNTFAILNGLPSEVELKAALAHYELPLEGTHHRGIDDAKNIAKIFINMTGLYRTGCKVLGTRLSDNVE